MCQLGGFGARSRGIISKIEFVLLVDTSEDADQVNGTLTPRGSDDCAIGQVNLQAETTELSLPQTQNS
jgi:hypothetical protein